MKVSIDRLREALSYDPETGVLTWRANRGRIRAGAVAGCAGSNSHLVRFDRVLIKTHRAIWAMHYGYWPEKYIDHVNGDFLDNRIENLREATHAENMQNRRKARAGSRQGLIGVTANGKGFAANICVNREKRYLGTFRTPQEANAAYIEAKRKLHPFGTL